MTEVSTYRGYKIETDGVAFYAAGRIHNSAWSAICWIDELLAP